MNRLISSRISNSLLRTSLVRPMTTASAGPLVEQVEKNWINLPEQEKRVVVEKLETIMKNDWNAVDLQDKRAIYYIDYGSYGFRTPISQKGEGLKIFLYTTSIIGASIFTSYMIHVFFGSRPPTMTKEWQEESNEYARSQNNNPITGVSSKGYTGTGFVHQV
ncbi:Cytochrome c oxidase polypeptide 5, mitochondrial [Smittium mucronatum]|uniref:Cytochrome c oxidase polypeptide 5, mitochondrial n=1 Tax=Smittium mucronatum TaxID=133383 RepID=A0A1R0H1V3_9FUNG|nr:Cytochrome c oxidase polypeptide 5, mitochondrial [Smittium mucronatum]